MRAKAIVDALCEAQNQLTLSLDDHGKPKNVKDTAYYEGLKQGYRNALLYLLEEKDTKA